MSKFAYVALVGAARGVAVLGLYQPTLTALLLGGASTAALCVAAQAQSASTTPLPAVTVTADQDKAKNKKASKAAKAPPPAASQQAKKDVTPPTPQLTLDQELQSEGTAQQGYKVGKLSRVGPFPQGTILDTPYSFSVMPKEMIENLQSGMADKLYEVNPFTQPSVPSSRGFNTLPSMRGFQPAQLYQGLPEAPALNPPSPDLEDKERVEILSGLSGFLNGMSTFAQPGGSINFVLKRPTEKQFMSVTAGDYGGSNLYTHLDAGGPAGSAFGYRLNVLYQDGETAVDSQNLERQLVSGAFDIHLADNFLVQVDAAYSDHKTNGTNAAWSVLSGLPYPSAPDASELWGQKFSFSEVQTSHLGTGVTWNISDAVTFRADARYYSYDFIQLYANNQITSPSAYTAAIFKRDSALTDAISGDAFLDVKANTFGLAHNLTFGYFASQGRVHSPNSGFVPLGTTPGLPLSGPTFIPQPPVSFGGPRTLSSVGQNQNFVVGDQIKIGKSWELVAGLNDTKIKSMSYGATTTKYEQTEITPTVALIFKPLPWLSTYVSYIEALEVGGTAAATANGPIGVKPVTNANEVQPPVVDTQYEAGIKADVGGVLATLAVFDIKRASNIYTPNGTDSYTFSTDGEEEHKGVEVGLTGKVFSNLTLYGGFTVMNNEIVSQPANPTVIGKQPSGVAEEMAKLYAEYDVAAIPGLTLTGGVTQVGSFYADALNTTKVGGYVIGSAGMRYKTRVYGTETVFRLNVDNITDENYWMSPSYVGAPRTVLFSGTTKF